MEPAIDSWMRHAEQAALGWKAATGAAAFLAAMTFSWWNLTPSLAVVRPIEPPEILVARRLPSLLELPDASHIALVADVPSHAESPLVLTKLDTPVAPQAEAPKTRKAALRARMRAAAPLRVHAPRPPARPAEPSRKPHYPYVRGPAWSGFPVT